MSASTVPAGVVTFVVEHRRVEQGDTTAAGATVRVLGASDGHEYLRFDMFDVSPHYHYRPPGEAERIVMLDVAAEGDAVTWGIERLRGRLASMLDAAGGRALVGALDMQAVAPAVDDVEALVRTPSE